MATNRARIAQKQRETKYRSPKHRNLRKVLNSRVMAGLATCVRCGELIEPGPWDLGHDDKHPWLHTGPEHTWCNRGAPHRNVTSRQW